MHIFTPRWAESWREAHDVVPHAHTFTGATDLIAFAEFDRLTLWRSWPEIWHLDSSGAVLCSSKALSTDTVRADTPQRQRVRHGWVALSATQPCQKQGVGRSVRRWGRYGQWCEHGVSRRRA
jgi:hypothetical protein